MTQSNHHNFFPKSRYLVTWPSADLWPRTVVTFCFHLPDYSSNGSGWCSARAGHGWIYRKPFFTALLFPNASIQSFRGTSGMPSIVSSGSSVFAHHHCFCRVTIIDILMGFHHTSPLLRLFCGRSPRPHAAAFAT